MAEINMIPLIDVSLVLLIIFMVMTPFLVKSKIRVNLPKAGSGETEAGREKPVAIQVEKDGGIYVNSRRVPVADLEKALRQVVPDPRTQAIVVEADKDVPFQQFITVVDIARKIGVVNFSVAVKQPHAVPARGR